MRADLLLLLMAGLGGAGGGAREALAATLGRAHALHRLCAGPGDDLWRRRMASLIGVEHATPAQRDRLVGVFNAGYAEAGTKFAACTPGARAALTATLREGREQAARLAEGGT